MKQIFKVLTIIFLFNSCSVKQENFSIKIEDLAQFEPTIVLMHPTVNNLKTFLFLTEQEIFPFDSKARILGIYHTKGTYNYNLSIDFLRELADNRFKLLEVKEEIDTNNIFAENGCTSIFKQVFENSQGIIFFGGPDLPPSTYGKSTSLMTDISDTYRHYIELSFLYNLLGGYQDSTFTPFLESKPDYRILGICLGMQSMNVASGGTMIQDIPSELYGVHSIEEVLAFDMNDQHRNYNTNLGLDKDLIWGHLHQIRFEENTLFHSLNGFSSNLPFIWSSHHQAVDRVGKGFYPIAWSLDNKIVEAIKHSRYPNVLGVQFHPEVPSIYEAEKKLKRVPFEEVSLSYIEMHPNDQGEDFHRAFWRMIGDWYK
jgi:putative glutamine amidotransferase